MPGLKVLFDQGVPVPLRRELAGHAIDTLFERGWSNLENGKLLDAAEGARYDVLVTTDQNIKHQQNLVGRQIAIVVLMSTAWPRIRQRTAGIITALEAVRPGELVEVPI